MNLGLALLLVSVLSGEPQTAVVVSKTTTVPQAEVERVADDVAAALREGGVEVMGRAEASAQLADAGVPPPSNCEGKSACLGAAAAKLNLRGLVGVFVTEVVGERTAFVSLVKRDEQSPIAKRDFLVVPNEKLGRAELGDFVSVSRALLAPPEVVFQQAPPKDHTTASLVFGAGAAALVAGVITGAIGVNAKSHFDSLLGDSLHHTQTEVQAAAGPANVLPVIGIGLGIAAAVAGGVGVVLW